MAVVIPIAVMAHDGGKKVHPFFSKPQNVQHDDVQAQPTPNSTSSADAMETDLLDSHVTVAGDSSHPSTLKQNRTVKRQSSVSVVVIHDRHPTETSSLDADPNHERRKRVKTDNGYVNREIQEVVNNGGVDCLLVDPARPQRQDEKDVEAGLLSSLNDETTPENPTKQDIEAPVPVLKLNGKGTLGSPKTKVKPEQKPVTKASKSRASPNTGKDVSTKQKNSKLRAPAGADQRDDRKPQSRIVVMTYQGNTIGERISSILSGVKTTSPRRSPRKAVQKVSNPTQEPAKPAHPFFMKKSQTKKDVEKSPGSSSTIQDQPKTDLTILAKGPTAQKSDVLDSVAQASVSKTSSSGGFGGFLLTQRIKYPGLKEPPWPWKGTSHIRGIPENSEECSANLDNREYLPTTRKSKGSAVYVQQDENILSVTSQRMPTYGNDQNPEGLQKDSPDKARSTNSFDPFSKWKPSSVAALRIPEKLIMTGPQIQSLTREKLASGSLLSKQDVNPNKRSRHLKRDPNFHPAVFASYLSLGSAMTPFDINKCETKNWTQKYSPATADQVLQPGLESAILFEWLLSHTIHKVDTGKHKRTISGSSHTKSSVEKPKKRRKRASDLDGFIASESEDESEFGELTDVDDDTSRPFHKRSYVRHGAGKYKQSGLKRSLNTVLLSGPNGSGKTAAVYAAAKELEFEVFEINPGSRRNGKDILDRIGDMTENHLVQQVSKTVSASMPQAVDGISVADTANDDDNTRQGSMTTFFKPAHTKQPTKGPKSKKGANLTANDSSSEVAQIRQKQSLILFEEVDVLFQEDKQFWATVLALAVHSKRPIVLTCNDENVVPQEGLNLHALLRFMAPPINLAVDYLLLLAAREGHLLTRHAVESLYISKDQDLRASITELQFWCQMGVGDDKGGLNWMVDRWPPGCDYDKSGDKLRAMSNGTYLPGMGWSDRDLNCSINDTLETKEENLFCEAFTIWDASTDDLAFERQGQRLGGRLTESVSLEDFAEISEKLSAADDFCGGMRRGFQASLDPSHPLPTTKARLSYTESYPLLSAYPTVDFTHLPMGLNACTTLLSRKALSLANLEGKLSSEEPFNEESFIRTILGKKISNQTKFEVTRKTFAVMDPIAGDIVSDTGTVTASCFDREFRVLVEEIAPFVRSIAEHDLVLEVARAQTLSSTKRARTSRASRSALEGGLREEKRRDRWFTKDLNLQQVLKTGGTTWYQRPPEIAAADSPSTITSNEL